ncbi:Uncharacterised protein [Chryseobacterium gleum]|uniref:Uncharacterized protein n=3 Tax=Chryseobacterium gleum TaxID=250 RepID=A0A448B2Y2_CHRGE|nr:hypothetical protein HMPREF0204_12005 [Chryseobacterium gleum ATCC 35910]VEE08034.1 Uncharacterised protein [Chryseobacterium gleum]
MEFEYKKNKILGNLILGYFYLCFTIFITVMILRNISREWNTLSLSKIFSSTIPVFLFSFLTYLFLGTALIRRKYYLQNLKEEAKIDPLEKQIIILDKQSRKERRIDFNKVKAVELYYSWNSNAFSSDLGYSKIVLEDNAKPVLITQNNINQYYIYKAFKNKVTVNKSRFANNL